MSEILSMIVYKLHRNAEWFNDYNKQNCSIKVKFQN